LINLDFADVKAIMANAGSALMGIGNAKGDNRAVEAARQAIDSPLLETSIEGARGVLFNITGGMNMTMHEIDEAAKTITEAVASDANIIFGAVLDEALEDHIQITVVATGFDNTARSERTVEVKTVPRVHQPAPAPMPEPDPEPVYTQPVVMPVQRQPLINERPQTAVDEPVQVPVSRPEPMEPPMPPRRFASLASIEPEDNEPAAAMPTYEEPVETEEPMARPAHQPSQPLSDLGLAEDDDLDVPAFIRRKVD